MLSCCLQDGARLDFERQRAAGRIQQLQGELSTMKAQQNKLRQRLQERLDAQDRDAVIKSRELASLRRAGEEVLVLPDCQGVESSAVAHSIRDLSVGTHPFDMCSTGLVVAVCSVYSLVHGLLMLWCRLLLLQLRLHAGVWLSLKKRTGGNVPRSGHVRVKQPWQRNS